MFKNISNKTLSLVFAGLLIIAILIIIKDSGSGERTFRSELVDIDTSAVTQILIYPKATNGSEVKLFKDDDNDWKVELANGNLASVPKGKIDNILNQVIQIKPSRLAARGEDKWKEFEVDSSATRVKFYEDDDKVLDMMIGRFSFQQPRTMNTYVRLTGETEIYEVEGFLSMTFNKKANDFRDQTIIKGDPENWMNIVYNYPADSSYQLVKVDDKWTTSAGVELDSAKTANQLRRLSNITGTEFVDVDRARLMSPEMTLQISTQDGEPIEVNAFNYNDTYIINSSQNPDAFFDGNKNGLWKKVFVGLKKFQ